MFSTTNEGQFMPDGDELPDDEALSKDADDESSAEEGFAEEPPVLATSCESGGTVRAEDETQSVGAADAKDQACSQDDGRRDAEERAGTAQQVQQGLEERSAGGADTLNPDGSRGALVPEEPFPTEAAVDRPNESDDRDTVQVDNSNSVECRSRLETRMRLPIARLERTVRVRDLRDREVDGFVEDFHAGAKFPPVEAMHYRDADGIDHYPIVTGYHRVTALERVGELEVDVIVTEGTLRDARWAAAASNLDHGIRRNDDDKRRAVDMLLEDPEWRDLADRRIASHVRISPTSVGKFRGEFNLRHGIDPEQAAIRTGLDGRQLNYANRRKVSDAQATQLGGASITTVLVEGESGAPKPTRGNAPGHRFAVDVERVRESRREADRVRGAVANARVPAPVHEVADPTPAHLDVDAPVGVRDQAAAREHAAPGSGGVSTSVLTVEFVNGDGVVANFVLDLGNMGACTVPEELGLIRPAVRTLKKLFESGVSRQSIDGVVDRIWTAG